MSKISTTKKTIQRPIYEVIHDPFIEEKNSNSSFRPMYKNPNQPQFLPSDVKIVLKIMTI